MLLFDVNQVQDKHLIALIIIIIIIIIITNLIIN